MNKIQDGIIKAVYEKPQVKCIQSSPLIVASNAIRTAWQSFDKSDSKGFKIGEKDKELIHRVGNKFKHSSTLEHIVYTFEIDGISRACLQELARHRIASYTVKSTRYTLKELKNEKPFIKTISSDGFVEWEDETAYERASKYIVWTETPKVDSASLNALEAVRKVIKVGISNDKVKFCIPEAYKTSLVWTINMRSLQNFFALRSDKSALWEIRKLAEAVYDALPDNHKYMFEEYFKG